MNIQLDAIEARIIGCLMEKSMLTPDQYPLSLNAMVNACNQKSSREPVLNLSEREVQASLEGLQKRFLVREKSGFGGRVPKYHYRLYNDEIGDFRFSSAERAVVCLLLLRGPQTPGELRTRAGRMHDFADTEAVEETLEALMHYEQGPFVVRLGREPGRRETRYAERFSDRATELSPRPAETRVDHAERPRAAAAAAPDRLDRLEQRVAALEAALAAFIEGRSGGQ
jgi:hypothetical protein